jgi:hypothetical protein
MEENILQLPQLVQSSVKMTDTVLGTLEAHARSKGGTHWGFSETNMANADTAALLFATDANKVVRFAKYIISKELSKEYKSGAVSFNQLLKLEVRLALNEEGEELYIVGKPAAMIGFAMDKVEATDYKPKSSLSEAEALKWAGASV